MRERILKKLAHWQTTYPWRMLIIVLMITIILITLAQKLSVTMRTSDLLPEGDPRVVQFNKVIDEFATASNLVVVVQGEESRIKAFADELAPQILTLQDTSLNELNRAEIKRLENKIISLKKKGNKVSEVSELKKKIAELEARINKKIFQRVDYKVEIDFLRNHLFMLIKEDDLKNTKDVFLDPNLTGLISNLNNSMEKEYIGQEESISTREQEDGAFAFLDGIQSLALRLQQALQGEPLSDEQIHELADKLLFGEPYMLSYDKNALVMIGIPNFTIMERDLIMIGKEAVQKLIDNLLLDFPDIKAGLSGSIAREYEETVYSEETISKTTILAFIVIFILLMISFRMWVAPLLAILTLFVGVIWAMGASWLAVGQLNLMTAMMSIILLGLGIDFAIHIISGFTEHRAAGESIPLSLQKTYLKSARGVITGALTTACAFLTLVISQARGLRELGIVIGVGLLSIMLSTLIFLPILLVLREKRLERKRVKKKLVKKTVERDISFNFLGRIGQILSSRYVFTVLTSLFLTLLFVWFASRITFDHNYMNLEPEGLTSLSLMDTVLKKFDLNMEYTLILTDNVTESRKLAKKSRDLGSVAMTDDISLYLPSSEEQQKRLPHLLDIRNNMENATIRESVSTQELPILRKEIERLEMNIMEMQDLAYLGGKDKVDQKCSEIVGNPDNPDSKNMIRELLGLLISKGSNSEEKLSKIQRNLAPHFKNSVLRACSPEPLQLEELPNTILDRYSNRSRDQFLITIYPAGPLWEDKAFLDRFNADIDRVSEEATGAAPLFTALIKIFGRDGRNAILLTLLLVFSLLWFDFKNPKHALIAMIPLACGVFWMVGFMYAIGMKLNIMNLIGLPLIIGIGIDDGVHIMHRWRYEGIGHIRRVFSSTGKAILLTSLTTMFAFGSLYFSVYRGWASFGASLFIGVAACFLATIYILPGILGMVEKKNSKNT